MFGGVDHLGKEAMTVSAEIAATFVSDDQDSFS